MGQPGNRAGITTTLANLKPQTLAVMHGSSYAGDGERAVRELARVIRDTLGQR